MIVPDLPALLDVVRPGENALVYRASDTEDLLRVMLEAAEMPVAERLRMRAQALQAGREVDFDRLAGALLDAIPPAPRRSFPISCRPSDNHEGGYSRRRTWHAH